MMITALCNAAGPATLPASNPAGDPFDTRSGPSERTKAGDLVRFSLTDGLLTAQTSLRPTQMTSLTVENLAAPVSVTIVYRGDPAKALYTPDMFRIEYDRQGANNGLIRTSLIALANGTTNLSRDVVAGQQESSIQYTQTARPGGETVRLYIQNLSASSPAIQYTATSFAEFVRAHPAETTLYLRPMVEAFGPQPDLFAIDDTLGCNVFPEAYEVDPAARKQIMGLVADLNADDFQKRQKAGESLEKMGVKAATVLSKIDRSQFDPEQATRIDAIIDAIRPRSSVDPKTLREDPGFLLDCLLSSNASLRSAAFAQLKKVTAVPLPFTDPADAQARFKEVYAIRARLKLDAPSTQPVPPASPQ